MSGAELLEGILQRFRELPPDKLAAVKAEAMKATAHLPWVPNPGPQTEAVICEADELFYGGQAGGGKTDLILGLALTRHSKSLVLRRLNKDVIGLADRIEEILGHRDGWNGQHNFWRLPNGKIDLGGCEHEKNKEGYKGKPHDLIAFDELPDFSETQYTFIIGWNRSTDPKQRCRIVAAGNPPTSAEGLWIVKRWGAWLDPQHSNPAKPGELRWYTTIDGKDTEVDGPGPHLVGNREVMARSRTFLPATLEDNLDLLKSGYAATLEAMPEPYRSAYRDGRFDVGLKDDEFQLIPTAWVREAQQRWTPEPPQVPMTAMGVDVASGGPDSNVIAIRYDAWFAKPIVVPGTKTPLGTDIAGTVISHRRNGAKVVLDVGGGYGGSTYSHLRDNNIDVTPFNGATQSARRTVDKRLAFYNKRAEAWWTFREALDPSQHGGSPVALPDDPELVADLVAPRFEVTPRGIKVEAKEDIKERIGRSPDKGDAFVMCWSEGQHGIARAPRVNNSRPRQTMARTGRNPIRRAG